MNGEDFKLVWKVIGHLLCMFILLFTSVTAVFKRVSKVIVLITVSWIFTVMSIAGDVKEPTHSSQRVGHVVPGVVIWSLSINHLLVKRI